MKSSAPRAIKRPWKLWQFAVVVLASALVFATIRALARESEGPLLGLYTLVVIALAGAAPFVLIRSGRKVAGRATSGLKRWGVERGGVIGFLAWVGAGGVEVGYYLGSLVIGPVATIALLLWLARLASR